MNYRPILLVAGEPNSVFLEIFFKSLKAYRYKRPLIIIVSKNLLLLQMKSLGYNFKLNLINKNNFNLNKLSNNEINLINVDYAFKNNFEKISSKSNNYITQCFDVALEILKKKKSSRLINGPISKKHFLQGRYLGITEYLAKKTKTLNFAMLIYNKKLSVGTITTHLPLKDVHKHITKIKIVNQIQLIKNFYKKTFKKNPYIAVTGLNPHCESNYTSSEEENKIKPAIKYLSSMCLVLLQQIQFLWRSNQKSMM